MLLAVNGFLRNEKKHLNEWKRVIFPFIPLFFLNKTAETLIVTKWNQFIHCEGDKWNSWLAKPLAPYKSNQFYSITNFYSLTKHFINRWDFSFVWLSFVSPSQWLSAAVIYNCAKIPNCKLHCRVAMPPNKERKCIQESWKNLLFQLKLFLFAAFLCIQSCGITLAGIIMLTLMMIWV